MDKRIIKNQTTDPEAEKSTETSNDVKPPRRSSIIEMLLKVDPDHHLVKKYNAQVEEYQKNLQEQITCLERKPNLNFKLPELKPMKMEKFYERFLEAFEYFNKKKFDEEVNDGEGRHLARLLCSYLAGRKSFYENPLLNSEVSQPDLNKGILIVGGKGVGKTAIVRTFHDMFFYARNNPLTVEDSQGNHQPLRRYKLGFGFFSADEVVDAYEFCANEQEKKAFNNKFAFGFKGFDDIMAEEMAQNYGKRDIFRKLFEKRYYNKAKTMVTMNYYDEENGIQKNLSKTLNAFGDRYGDRVFDRSYEMFNIAELKGESLRK
jgi:DNA replication protein DnaC